MMAFGMSSCVQIYGKKECLCMVVSFLQSTRRGLWEGLRELCIF
jgi:hypothetical protein